MKDLAKEKQLKEVLYGLDYIGNKAKNEDAILELGKNNCKLLLEEIERLNNIITELENHINSMCYETLKEKEIMDCILNKLKELKGSDKE